jgi:transcriptional regulator with XRE-family HTH domain
MAKSIHRSDYALLTRRLREAREVVGLTQVEVSAALCRPQSFVSDIENGRRRLDILQLRDLCQLLGVSWVDFLRALDAEMRRAARAKGR